MSRNAQLGTGRGVQPQQPYQGGQEEEEEENAMDVEEADTDELTAFLTKARSPADIAERLALHLETHPEDPEARALVKFNIRKIFISHGGMPFNKQDAIPYDLDSLTDKELLNVLENMVIFTARTQQKELVGKALNAVTNISYIFAGNKSLPAIKEIERDTVLRDSLFEAFLGTKFGPLLSLLIVGASHVSNLARNYVDGKRTATEGGRGDANGANPNSAATGARNEIPSNNVNKASV